MFPSAFNKMVDCAVAARIHHGGRAPTSRVFAALVLLLVGSAAVRAEMPIVVDPIQVMVLGTYHFGNPGHDEHNTTADDVRSPRRQAELAAVARVLAEFHPTHVMVEEEIDTPDLAVPAYQHFATSDLARERNEIVQIGFRLAHVSGAHS